MTRPIVLPIPASLQRIARKAVKRRPDLQAEWLRVMDGPNLMMNCECDAARAHAAAMTPARRAELEEEW